MLFCSRLILILILLSSLPARAQDREPIVIPSNARQTIGLQTTYFLDKSTTVSLKDILENTSRYPFLKSSESTFNFGPTAGACWIRFEYTNRDSLSHFLEIGNAILNKIDFFVVDNGKIIKYLQTGVKGRNSSETFKLNVWLLELPSAYHRANTVYIRVIDSRRVIIPLQITDLDSSIKAHHKTDFLFGLYFGCIVFIAALNIFFFLYFKEKIYLFYSFHLITQILINGILKGYLFSLFGNELFFLSPHVSGIAGISNISFILFSLAFLDVQKLSYAWYRAGLWLIVLPGLNIILNLTGLYTFSAVAGIYVGYIVILFLFLLGLYAYRHKVKQARFYVIGWTFFFLGIIILGLTLMGWFPVTGFTYNATVFGLLFEVLLISAALADRINLVRVERELERNEKIQLIEQQKSWLEENVKLRTQELMDKNYEIEAQNEELKQQHEELSTTHEMLERQRQVVENKNKDIENINQSLEQKVHQRTMELEETVKRLIKHNHDLQQFSYIVSHNLRAPLVRILGLLDLMKMEGVDEEEQEQIYLYLKESALGLDQIIHDLSDIIAIRKGLETMVDEIDIASILRHSQRDLDDEIRKAKVIITTSINVGDFVSVKSYIQSILYNLLSNAIKYRSQERRLTVHIHAYEEIGNVVFEVIDNGMGIDLSETRLNEIFNLYKRLHQHIPGKGLGLYLVKTQVEALNGKIEVKTTLGEGTTFKVSIPKN